jgi:hypothetical protein
MKQQNLKSKNAPAAAKPERSAAMVAETAFTLSRVYAEGWNAAKQLTASECDDLDPKTMAALNPHGSDAKRQRWNEGFAKALGK